MQVEQNQETLELTIKVKNAVVSRTSCSKLVASFPTQHNVAISLVGIYILYIIAQTLAGIQIRDSSLSQEIQTEKLEMNRLILIATLKQCFGSSQGRLAC